VKHIEEMAYTIKQKLLAVENTGKSILLNIMVDKFLANANNNPFFLMWT